MMEKRDLKADLELCNKATSGPWMVWPRFCGPDGQTVYQEESGGPICDVADPYPRGDNHPQENMEFIAAAREGWPHAIERALEAEALARELVDALRGVSGMLDYATRRCRCGVCEYCNAQERADKALAKAKEVLDDEA